MQLSRRGTKTTSDYVSYLYVLPRSSQQVFVSRAFMASFSIMLRIVTLNTVAFKAGLEPKKLHSGAQQTNIKIGVMLADLKGS